MTLFKEYRGLRRELYVLLIGRIMTSLGSMVGPVFTLILNNKLHMSATQIGVWMMVCGILGMPMNLLGGKLADKFNKRNIIVICDVISILGFLWCAFTPINYTAIVIFSAASMLQSIEGPSYDALVADFTTSENRERAYSMNYLGNNLGLVASPTIAGLLMTNHLDLCFLINGVAIGFSTILIFLFIKDLHREEDDSPAAAYEAAVDEHVPVFKLLFENRSIWMFIIATGFSWAVYGMWGYLMPLSLTAAHGEELGATLFGTMSSVNCAVVVIFTAAVTRFLARLDDLFKMILGEGLILGGFAIFALLIKIPVMCYVAITIFTFGEILITITSSPFITRRIPSSHRGRIISVSSVYDNLFSSGVELVIGFIYDRAGGGTAWGTVFAMGGVMLLLFGILRGWDKKDYPGLYHVPANEGHAAAEAADSLRESREE